MSGGNNWGPFNGGSNAGPFNGGSNWGPFKGGNNWLNDTDFGMNNKRRKKTTPKDGFFFCAEN
jgi:hypothetical protein